MFRGSKVARNGEHAKKSTESIIHTLYATFRESGHNYRAEFFEVSKLVVLISASL